jgi:3-hydroxyisobutyrate dehydrogenase-like beta-hydroxyacid dehydrogenase
MDTALGFIGLGKMGQPIVANLLEAGYRVTVHDVRPDAVDALVTLGAAAAASPAAVAEASTIVFTSLPGPAEVEAVATGPGGVLSGLAAGDVLVDLSSNAPDAVVDLARRFAEQGRHLADAPIGGRSILARTKDLQVMVGGSAEVFDRCAPVLSAFAKRVVHCGETGSGAVCKLMHNAINAVFRQSAGECFTTAVKAGVDPAVLWDIVRNGITVGGSEINKTMPATWLRGSFDTGTGALRTHRKDTALAVELGHRLGVPMPHVELTLHRLDEALERGWGSRDATVSLLIQEELAGVAVRFDRDAPS